MSTLTVHVAGGMDIMRELYLSDGCHGIEGYGHVAVPRLARFAMIYFGGPLHGFEQYWFCWMWAEHGWPTWPGRVAGWLLSRLSDLIDPYCVNYCWNPPDSGIPNEVGFWSIADGSHERSPMRVFWQSFSGTNTTPATGSESL